MTPPATSALLPQEPVLLVQGRLAAALGLAPALFLQQVHYWLLRSRHEYGGQPWIYNTYSQWQMQFPFLSRDQLARAVATLRRLGVLQVAHWDADRRERRNWYSIDYARLAAVLGTDDLPAPMIADLSEGLPTSGITELPDTASVLTRDPIPAAIPTSSLLANVDEAEAVSARSCPTDRTPMVQMRTMDDSPVAAHPEITRSETIQRLPQEEDLVPAHVTPPPPPASCVSEAIPLTPVASAPSCPGPSLRTSTPSAPDGAESSNVAPLPSVPDRLVDRFSMRPFAPIMGMSVPSIGNSTSAFRVPRSDFVWGAYRAALDPALPKYERGARNAEGGGRRDAPYQQRYQQPDQQTDPRPRARAGLYPPPPDPRKYAPGGKYGHLFARQAAASP